MGWPRHPCLLPPGEKELMAEALSVSKRNLSYQRGREAYCGNFHTLRVPQQS